MKFYYKKHGRTFWIFIILLLFNISGCITKEEDKIYCVDYIINYMNNSGWELVSNDSIEFVDINNSNLSWNLIDDTLLLENEENYYNIYIRQREVYKNNDFTNNIYDFDLEGLDLLQLEDSIISTHAEFEEVGCPVFGKSHNILNDYRNSTLVE